MAESTKGASSTVKSKDKRSSSFDLDMGDDFLKSLKSMAVGDDDAMDFDFGPVSKNKKKTFNFDKEDMDFNLDSDFGKISSFNIDMSDLDISSPCKKDRKSKEMSKEESTAAGNKKKGDGFNFSFDFELDSFGFGSSQESREKAKNHKEKESFNFRSSQESREKAKNNKEKDSFSFGSSQDSGERAMNDQEKECSSKKNGHEGLNEDTGSLGDGVAQKHTASEAGMTFTVDSHINIDKHHDTRKHSLPSNHAMGDNEIPKFQSVSSVVAVEKDKSLLQETVSPRAQETDCQVEEGTLISQSESRRDSSGLQEHVDSMPADVSFLAVGTDINKKVLLDSNTNYEKSVLESSSLEDVATTMKKAGEKSTFESDKHLENNKDRTEAQSNSMYVTNATEDKMQDMKVSDEEQSQNSELSATSLSNGIEAEKLTSGKRGDAGIIRSKFFMPSVKPAAQMQKTTSLTETKVPAFGNKRIDPIPQSCPVEIISQDNKDDKTGSKAGFPPDSRSLPTIKPRQTENQESYQVSGIKKMGSQLDAVESIRTSIGSLRPNEQNVKQGKSAPEKSQASSTDLFTFSSRVCPPSKSHQTTTSTPVSIAAPRNLTITAPTPTAKNTIKEGERSLPVKAAMRTLDTSSLKISAKLGANVETSRTVLQNNMKSSKTGDRHGLKAISQAKDTNFTERLKQMPANLSMKRKVPETNSDLMILLPSKRLSPNGTRGSYEGTERICHKQFNDHEHTGHGNKTSAYEHSQISSQDIPVKMNIQELGSPSAVEDDDSIKKAQACSKGLDDICNMLRKKHEEAKEILVRAIVNNNKLLLLNHPIYEEKISLLLSYCRKPSFSYFPNL